MRKVLILLFIVGATFTSCIKPTLNSVVDNSLFTQPYKKPLFVIVYKGKYDKLISYLLVNKLKETFGKNSAINPFFQIYDGNSKSISEIDAVVESTLKNNSNDLLFIVDIKNINLYDGVNGTDVLAFNFLITGYDKKINKEVWKSDVFSPKKDAEMKKMADQLVQKLYSDKVL